ncbi:MAG: histidine ammonia-lyase [Halobacteriota archaeon]
MSDDPTTVVLDGETLSVDDVVAVAREGATVKLTETTREAVRESRRRIEHILDSDRTVYGVNTGFGELVDTPIPREQVDDLQTNLLRSHAAGAGRELSTEEVRAVLVTRVNALVRGYSGVREVVVDTLVTLLNDRIHPVVRSRGSLGASGDLAPLAHLSLVLVGEGEALVEVDGTQRRLPGDEALAVASVEPLALEAKEGLALINGTQLSVGLAALAVFDAERTLRAGDTAGALTTEVTLGTTAACDPAVHALRPHRGQAASARNVKRLTAGSDIVESHRNCDRVQDAYSIRCLPQVHGAVRDALAHLREAVEVELNSVTDNPLVFPRDEVDPRASGTDRAAVISGGNFHGEPLALRLDYATSALTELAAISERRVDRMVNPNLQEPYLPPFLTSNSGVQSGYMISQYTAAALLNECRAEGRFSTDNTPVSGGQEDHVSMSASAAFAFRRVVERVRTIVAIELLCAAQAAEFVRHAPEVVGASGVDDADEELPAYGAGTGAAYDAVREVVAPLEIDRPSDGDVEAVAMLVESGTLESSVESALSSPLE